MNDTSPLLSIVCITYNHEPYIRQCLEGFLMQKINFNIEILINDDASTDKTQDIIKEYELKYPDIIKPIYQKENQYSKGVHPWFNILFPIAKGKYIAICEGDDYWIDHLKLQKQVDFLEKNADYSLCFHNAVVYYQNNEKSIHIFNDINKDKDCYFSDIINRWIVPTASIVLKKEYINPVPLWACDSKIISTDMLLCMILLDKYKAKYLHFIGSIYRVNLNLDSSSLTSYYTKNIKKRIVNQIYMYNLTLKHLPRYKNHIKNKINNLNNNLIELQIKEKGWFVYFACYPLKSIKLFISKIINIIGFKISKL